MQKYDCYNSHMTKKIGQEANIPNPALKPFNFLIGEWETTGKHPLVPDTVLHGRAVFEWFEEGVFLVMRTEITNDSRFPSGLALIGSDNKAETYHMLYFDERGISRKYDMSIDGKTWKWWRDDPEFSQRVTVSISEDGLTMIGKGEMKKDDLEWEGDLDLTYSRINTI